MLAIHRQKIECKTHNGEWKKEPMINWNSYFHRIIWVYVYWYTYFHNDNLFEWNSIELIRGNRELTFEYIKLNGKLIAIDNSHTKKIFNTTRFLVLFRPNLIGYLSDRYRSIEIVHKCIIDDVPVCKINALNNFSKINSKRLTK